jgi:hypothetical protein
LITNSCINPHPSLKTWKGCRILAAGGSVAKCRTAWRAGGSSASQAAPGVAPQAGRLR